MSAVISAALFGAVALAWIGALGFARLGNPFDRLHSITFVNLGTGLATLLAAALNDGISTRLIKIALILVLNLTGGSAISHVVGRAILQREGDP